jgi:hypothetical protein
MGWVGFWLLTSTKWQVSLILNILKCTRQPSTNKWKRFILLKITIIPKLKNNVLERKDVIKKRGVNNMVFGYLVLNIKEIGMFFF